MGKSLETNPAKLEAWHRGILDWKLRPAQARIEAKFQEVQSRGGQFLFVNCSRRIGKTVWGAKKAVETLFRCKNEKPRVKIGSAFYDDLVEFIVPAHEIIMSDCPESIKPRYWPSKKKYISTHNKGEIKLVGLDRKPNGLRGNYGDLVILEEAGFMNRLGYLHSSVIMPMFMYRPGAMEVMIGTPPETPDHEYVVFMEKAKLDDAYIELTIDDNTELSPAEKQKCLDECMSDTDRMREYYCKVVVDASRAVVPEWRDQLVQEVPRDEYFGYFHKYDAMDLGVSDQTVCLFGYYDFRRAALIVEDEMMMQGPEMTTDKLASSINAKEKEVWGESPLYKRISDNDNPLLLQDMSAKHGLAFIPTRKDSLHAMVNQVRIWVKEGRIIVHPRCKLLIGCLRTAIWDDRRKAFTRSAVYGHYDALAALVYMVRNVNTSTNPIPRMHRMSYSTHFVKEDKSESETAKALKKALLT